VIGSAKTKMIRLCEYPPSSNCQIPPTRSCREKFAV
jgi:hypothetical protein